MNLLERSISHLIARTRRRLMDSYYVLLLAAMGSLAWRSARVDFEVAVVSL